MVSFLEEKRERERNLTAHFFLKKIQVVTFI